MVDQLTKFKTKEMKMFLFLSTIILNALVYWLFNCSFEYDYRQKIDLKQVNYFKDELESILDNKPHYDDLEFIYSKQVNILVNLVSHPNLTNHSQLTTLIQHSLNHQITRFYTPNMKHLVNLEFDYIDSQRYLGKSYRQTNQQVIRDTKLQKIKESYQYIQKQLNSKHKQQKLVVIDLLIDSHHETYILKKDTFYQNMQSQNFYISVLDHQSNNHSHIEHLILNILINTFKLADLKKYKQKGTSIADTFRQAQQFKIIQNTYQILKYYSQFHNDNDQIVREGGYHNVQLCLEYSHKIVKNQIDQIHDYYDSSRDIVYELYQFPQENKRGVYLTIFIVINIPTIQLIKAYFNTKFKNQNKFKSD